MSNRIVVVAGQRTPFGAFGGGLKDLSATELGVSATKATLEQAKFSAAEVDHVIFGTVVQSSSDSIYLPRHIGLKSGIPIQSGALGVNRLCGSGFQSWITAAQMILTGEARVVIAGGAEQMSQIPYVVRGARWGYRMGGGELEDYLMASLTDRFVNSPMAMTAENLAEKYQISRIDCDEYAIESQMRYKKGFDSGIFASEVTSIEIKTKKGSSHFDKDEHPKPESTLESISRLKPVFKADGVVTAANASGIVDGAAATLLMSESLAKSYGLKPKAYLKGWASVGCEPQIMGIGPAHAMLKALKGADLTLEKMDLIEVNEAFAAQFLAVKKELNLPMDRTNVHGGAIAVGHPLGASGTRIMNHLMYELERRSGRYAVGSACIGGGQGIAIILERGEV